MSITVPGTPGFLLPPSYPMRPFTVDEYHRLIQAGILSEDDPVELLEGWIVLKMPHNPPHDGTIGLVQEALQEHLPKGWCIRIQCAITTDESEPEPDVVIATGSSIRYLDHHPGPEEIELLVEVADSTLARDRDDKGRIYARAGIGCYWIVNLVDRRVEVYTDPSGPAPSPAYRQRQDYRPADTIPLVIDGQEVGRIPVRQLFP